jgi:GAF domain-containing protein
VVGLLTVLRKEAVPFGVNSQSLLGAVTDYASISIVNARLFQALEARARRLQQVAEAAQAGEHSKDERLNQMRAELSALLVSATQATNSLLAGGEIGAQTSLGTNLKAGTWAGLDNTQYSLLRSVQVSLQRITKIIDAGNISPESL